MPVRQHEEREIDPSWLRRSLDRHYVWGLVFMAMLIAAYPVYQWREPHLRSDAQARQDTQYTALGSDLFSKNCSTCHGVNATGGQTAPTLNAKQFLESATDDQIKFLVASGVPGSSMTAWSLDFGGTMTDQQIQSITTYLRSLEPQAPSIPDWRSSARAK